MIASFTEHRPLLFGIAYRMLGSVAEADDMVQETWLRWQQQDEAAVRSPKAWLVATITRLCIDQLRQARRTREDYYGVWLPEPLVESSSPPPHETAALADSLGMAFMLMLESQSPVERAVFLLREVFDYEYADIAVIIGKSEANCRQIVRRAKASLPRGPRPADTPPDARAREVVQRFLAAARSGKVEELLAVLTDDATLYTDGGGKVTAAGRPIVSADRVSRFFAGIRRLARNAPQTELARINGGLGALVIDDGRLDRTMIFELHGNRIAAIYVVRNPDKLRHVAWPTAGTDGTRMQS